EDVVFDEPGLSATVIPASKPDPNRLEIDLAVAAEARVGPHRVGVVTPAGGPAPPPFVVEAPAALSGGRPNGDPKAARAGAPPATLVGAVERPGDVDHFPFRAEAGQSLTFAVTAKGLGSALNGVLTLLDDRGREVAEAGVEEGVRDPVL